MVRTMAMSSEREKAKENTDKLISSFASRRISLPEWFKVERVRCLTNVIKPRDEGAVMTSFIP